MTTKFNLRLRKSPGAAIGNRLHLTAAAVAICFAGLTAHAAGPSERYLALADSADAYIKRGEWKLAEETLETALRLEPANSANVMLLSNLGVVRTNLRDFGKALEAFDIAKAMAPGSKSVRINLVGTLLEINDEETALKELDEILELDSLQEWSLRTRGLLLLSHKEYDAGLVDIERYCHHYEADGILLEAGGAANAAKGNNEAAIEWYDKSIQVRQSPEAWFARTLLKIQVNRLGEAEDDIRRAIVIFPDSGNLYLLRAMLKKQNHLLSEADEDRRTALRKGADPALAASLLD